MKRKRFDRRRRGASAVEFAMVAPILFALLLGFVMVGQLVGAHQVLTHAARAGCRKAVLSTTMSQEDVENVVRSYMRRGSLPAAVANTANVTVTPSPSTAMLTETEITVSVSVPISSISWVPTGRYFQYLDTLSLAGTASMERE